MDTHYTQIYKNAAAMQHSFHDYTHTTAHDPTTTLIRNEMHNLTNDIAQGKNPRTIDNRLRVIEDQLRRTQTLNSPATTTGAYASSPILNYNQRNFLHSNFQQMRQTIRQHPHF